MQHASRGTVQETGQVRTGRGTVDRGQYDIQISALQCWESIEKNYGCAACVTMSMMGEKLMPSACEVDIAGAIGMYALALASEQAFSPARLEQQLWEDREKVVCTHCSNYPKSFFENEIEIGSLDILGTVLGQEDTFGAVKGKVAPGDMTFFRISTDDPWDHQIIPRRRGDYGRSLWHGRGDCRMQGIQPARTDEVHVQEWLRAPCGNGTGPRSRHPGRGNRKLLAGSSTNTNM
jgi:hypothetical protein